ncbi:G/U mismatch-specific DNA glycosylase [Cupriavidus basilensis]|uniref:G/U mismatch-specific DNA glycosylase n=1 Tax=Cupriavidus basilensis TaxID=68895 RepID=UPI0039F6F2FB
MTEVQDPRVFSDPTGGAPSPPLPDVISEGLAVVFCGINPGMRAAASGHHFEGKGNRFWRVLHLAGFTPVMMRPENDRDLLVHRCGLTTAVARPTARADQLSPHEFHASTSALLRKIELHRPTCIAFLGKAAYAAISGQRQVLWGRQNAMLGGSTVWILPNPSGLNRSFSLDDLVGAYSALYLAYASPKAWFAQ